MTMRKERVLTGLHGRALARRDSICGLCRRGRVEEWGVLLDVTVIRGRPAGGPRLFPLHTQKHAPPRAPLSHRRSSRSPPLRSMVGRPRVVYNIHFRDRRVTRRNIGPVWHTGVHTGRRRRHTHVLFTPARAYAVVPRVEQLPTIKMEFSRRLRPLHHHHHRSVDLIESRRFSRISYY